MPEYLLPDVGEGLTEAEIVSWKVAVGDTVGINDIVVEIETAKSIVELPSPYAGIVSALLAAEGEMVEVGNPIIRISDGSEAQAPAAATSIGASGGSAGGSTGSSAGGGEGWGGTAEAKDLGEIDLSNPAASGGGEGESLVGRNKAEGGAVRRARRRVAADVAGSRTSQADLQDAFTPGASHESHEAIRSVVQRVWPEEHTDDPTVAGVVAPAPATARTLAKPPVRKLAKDLGVDLTAVTGSGEGGVITRADVEAAAAVVPLVEEVARGRLETSGTGAQRMPSSYADLGRSGVGQMTGARETREPIKGVRKMMAAAMSKSAFTAPHVTEWITVDVTATMEFVQRLKESRALGEVKVSPLLILARAVILAMRRSPEINSYWDDEAQEVVYKGYVNLGIAAATPRGLVVPNIKDADALSLAELGSALGGLTTTAREGKTQPADMAGGTFTITNVGVFGVDAGTPIINPGESAIIAFGAVRKQPWVITGADGGDEIAVRQITTLALSFDHRHIDGAIGSRFLADVAGILADPATALLY